MSVLIKDMEKPKSCYAVIDGESEYCPFVNTDDDCVLLLKKGTCEGTWEEQYSKCPLVEVPEPCEDAVSRANVLESFADLYDAFEDCSKGIINELHRKFEDLRTLPSVTSKPDHSGDATEMVECDDAVSRTDMLNELDGWIEEFDVNGHKESHADMKLVRRSMSQLPSVTSKRKTGKWIEDMKRFGDDAYHCDQYGAILEEDALNWRNNYFCYHCGAEMDGRE